MTTYHTKEWHQWRSAPKRVIWHTALFLTVFVVGSVGLGVLVSWWKKEPYQSITYDLLRGFVFYGGFAVIGLAVQIDSTYATLTVTPEWFEYRVLWWAKRFRWDNLLRVVVEWRGAIPIFDFTDRKKAYRLDCHDWGQPRQVADEVLSILAGRGIVAKQLGTQEDRILRLPYAWVTVVLCVGSLVSMGVLSGWEYGNLRWGVGLPLLALAVSSATALYLRLPTRFRRRRRVIPALWASWVGAYLGMMLSMSFQHGSAIVMLAVVAGSWLWSLATGAGLIFFVIERANHRPQVGAGPSERIPSS